MAHRNPDISKTVFFKNPKFWQKTLFIGYINMCKIQDGEKSLRIGAILGKNLEESPIYCTKTLEQSSRGIEKLSNDDCRQTKD
jgi:hypothetical protein